jgi:hypothetical protein
MQQQMRALSATIPPNREPLLRHDRWSDSLLARRIVIEGLTGRAALRARRALELRDGSVVSARSLDSAVQRAFATNRTSVCTTASTWRTATRAWS